MSDIERTRGDTYADLITLTDATTGAAIDVTGYSFLLTVDSRQKPDDSSTQVYQLTGAIVDAAAGKFEFAPTDVQADQVGTFYYDIQITDQQGRKRTIQRGKYKYVQDITK